MQRQKKLSHVKELIKEAYENNKLTYAELAKMYDCSEGTVRRTLVESGAERRGPGRRKGVKNKGAEETLNGLQQ